MTIKEKLLDSIRNIDDDTDCYCNCVYRAEEIIDSIEIEKADILEWFNSPFVSEFDKIEVIKFLKQQSIWKK